ncbi:hypothetical protein DFJ73DRAFT_764025 [Zopfochytrium polystomum]|nr:hypothetical protein DFJ73DRAFT_764025 [Zopfochytrium polystomum]
MEVPAHTATLKPTPIAAPAPTCTPSKDLSTLIKFCDLTHLVDGGHKCLTLMTRAWAGMPVLLLWLTLLLAQWHPPLPPVLGPAPGEKNNSQNAWLLGPFRSPLSPGSTKHRYGNHAWDQPPLWGPCMPETVEYRGIPGIEPGTSCTQSRNHTTRLNPLQQVSEVGKDPPQVPLGKQPWCDWAYLKPFHTLPNSKTARSSATAVFKHEIGWKYAYLKLLLTWRMQKILVLLLQLKTSKYLQQSTSIAGLEPAIFRSEVERGNHFAICPHQIQLNSESWWLVFKRTNGKGINSMKVHQSGSCQSNWARARDFAHRCCLL